jgi:hypothetical protein
MLKKLYDLIVVNWKTSSAGLAAAIIYLLGVAGLSAPEELITSLPEFLFGLGLFVFGLLSKDADQE